MTNELGQPNSSVPPLDEATPRVDYGPEAGSGRYGPPSEEANAQQIASIQRQKLEHQARSNPDRLKSSFFLYEPGPWGSELSANELVTFYDGTTNNGAIAVRAELNEDGTVTGFRQINVLSTKEIRDKAWQEPPHIRKFPVNHPSYYAGRWGATYDNHGDVLCPEDVQSRLSQITARVEMDYQRYRKVEPTLDQNQTPSFRNWIGKERLAQLSPTVQTPQTPQPAY